MEKSNTNFYLSLPSMQNLNEVLETLKDFSNKNYEIKKSLLSFDEKEKQAKENFEEFFKLVHYRMVYSSGYEKKRLFSLCSLSLGDENKIFNITLLENGVVLQEQGEKNRNKVLNNSIIEYFLIDFCNFLIRENKPFI